MPTQPLNLYRLRSLAYPDELGAHLLNQLGNPQSNRHLNLRLNHHVNQTCYLRRSHRSSLYHYPVVNLRPSHRSNLFYIRRNILRHSQHASHLFNHLDNRLDNRPLNRLYSLREHPLHSLREHPLLNRLVNLLDNQVGSQHSIP